MTLRAIRSLQLLGVLAAAGLIVTAVACKRAEPGTFATPQDAAAALAGLVGSGDEKKAEEIFGPGSMDLFQTGDPEEDRREAQQVKDMITAKVEFEELDANTQVSCWEKKPGRSRFRSCAAASAGASTPRPGEASCSTGASATSSSPTLDSLHEYVDAQREYQAEGRDGNPRAFAQRFFSTEGKHDGLYWQVAEGEPESPLGELLAKATDRPAISPEPYRGYYYRILAGQGSNAMGGEYSYLDAKGHMTRGFAAVAWPAKYGNSGVKTFLVNQRGIVQEKDLGAETDVLVRAMQVYDPDATWQLTADTLSEHEEEGYEEESPEAEPRPRKRRPRTRRRLSLVTVPWRTSLPSPPSRP